MDETNLRRIFNILWFISWTEHAIQRDGVVR